MRHFQKYTEKMDSWKSLLADLRSALQNTFPATDVELPPTPIPAGLRILKSIARTSHLGILENILFNMDTAALYLSRIMCDSPGAGYLPDVTRNLTVAEWIAWS